MKNNFLNIKGLNITLNTLFPNRCIECDDVIDNKEIICLKCFSKIEFTHWDFGENPLKQKAEFLFPIEKAFALMHFEKNSLSRKVIHQLKYSHQEKVGRILARWVCEQVDLSNQNIDLLASVPLHPKKLKERGYNQLHLFTERLSECFNIPYQHDLLKRDSYNKAQATQNKVYRESSYYHFSLIQKVENKHILLIDDVFTTGNTISTLAWELLKNKGNKISILVMAID